MYQFDKILPKQVGYFWTRINLKQPYRNRELGDNARSATSRFSGIEKENL
jgi:hypothetical protein